MNEEHEKRFDFRVQIGELLVSVARDRNFKLILGRADRDLGHVTISWGNQSGRIDVHHTHNLPGGAKRHEPLFTFDEGVVGNALLRIAQEVERVFQQAVLRRRRWVRPGWLGHHGYLVVWADIGDRDEYVRSVLPQVAPRRKRRYRFRFSRLDKLPEPKEHGVYNPSILHWLAHSHQTGPWPAVAPGKPPLTLQYIPTKKHPYRWFAYPAKMGLDVAHQLLHGVLPTINETGAMDVVRAIIRVLELDDFEEVRQAHGRHGIALINPRKSPR